MSVLSMFRNAYKTIFLKDKIGDVIEWQCISGAGICGLSGNCYKKK